MRTLFLPPLYSRFITTNRSYFKVWRSRKLCNSISLEKLDRFVSSSCPYFWCQFSAILAASQLYFVDILIIGYNIKGGSKKFFASKCTVLKFQSFSVGRSQMDDKKKQTKKLYSSSAVCFVRKNASSHPLYCFL